MNYSFQPNVNYGGSAPQQHVQSGLPFNAPQSMLGIPQGTRPRHPAARALDMNSQRQLPQYDAVAASSQGLLPSYQGQSATATQQLGLEQYSLPHSGLLANVAPRNANPFDPPAAAEEQGAAPASAPAEMNFQNLFITKIPRDVTDGSLLTIFKPFGAVSAKVMVDATSGYSKGFGFVVFPNEEQGRWVHDNFNKRQIIVSSESIMEALPMDRPTRQAYEFTMFPSHHDSGSAAKESTSLYIRNVPKSWDVATVVELLRLYGDPTYYAMRDDRLGQPVWVVYAEYDCLQCSKNALKNIHGMRPLVGQPPILAKYADNAEVRKFRRDKRQGSTQAHGLEGVLATNVTQSKHGKEPAPEASDDRAKSQAVEDTLTPATSQQASKDNPSVSFDHTGSALPYILDNNTLRATAQPQQTHQIYYASPSGSLLGQTAYLQNTSGASGATGTSSSYFGFHPTNLATSTHSATNGDLVVERAGSSIGSVYSLGMRGFEGNPLATLGPQLQGAPKVSHHPVVTNLQAVTKHLPPQQGSVFPTSHIGQPQQVPMGQIENSVYGGSVSAAGSTGTGTDRSGMSLNYGSNSPSLLSEGMGRGGSDIPQHPSNTIMQMPTATLASIHAPVGAQVSHHPSIAFNRRVGYPYADPTTSTLGVYPAPIQQVPFAMAPYTMGLGNPQQPFGLTPNPQYGGVYYQQ